MKWAFYGKKTALGGALRIREFVGACGARFCPGILAAAMVTPWVSHGFVQQTSATLAPFHWNFDFYDRDAFPAQNSKTLAIQYELSNDTSSPATRAAEWDAVRAAFAQWAIVPGTKVQFEELAPIPAPADVNPEDSRNTVVWFSGNRLVCNGSAFFSANTAALTCIATLDDGTIVEADMILNRGVNWFTDYNNPNPNGVFLEGVVLHEVGHLLGFNHSPLGAATMFWYTPPGLSSQIGLSDDERIGVRALYGTAAARSAGSLARGTVKMSGAPVFGAVVVAEDNFGIVRAATVTGADGTFQMPGMPPSPYAFRVSPLDPNGNLDSYLVRGFDLDEYRHSLNNAVTSFQTATNPPVVLAAGGTTTLDFNVVPGNPAFRITEIRPSFNPADRTSGDVVLRLRRGQTGAVLGVFVPGLPGTSATLRMTGGGVVYGATKVTPNALRGMSLVEVEVAVSADATPGIRSLWLQAAGKVAWANGFVEVLTDFPDVNHDGLDDAFQRRWFSPFTSAAAGPLADPDGDGWNNLREAAAGTNPTDPLSLGFRVLSVRLSIGGAQVTAETTPGKKFQLWSKPEVGSGAWSVVGSPILATGDTQIFLDPGAKDQIRFYRVQQVP